MAVKRRVKRRMGPQNSASRDAMFDAVERVLQEEGYAALSARRVAEVSEFNHQTVYYYFKTMDELILGAFHRRVERGLKQLEEALASDRPLSAVWRLYHDNSNARLNIEFNALGLLNEALRAEIIAYLERSRAMQEAAFAPLLKKCGLTSEVSAVIPAMLVMFVSNFLDREEAIGFTKGHDEMRVFADLCFRLIEAPDSTAAASQRAKPRRSASKRLRAS